MTTDTQNSTATDEARGKLAIRVAAMPADTNAGGNIFGGWLLSQMDVAAGITAAEVARGRVATVAITAMEFHEPVYVGDVLCCYVEIKRIGNTSITTHVQAWVDRRVGADIKHIKVTQGDFVFVAMDEHGNKCKVPS